MPTYGYECKSCKHSFDIFQSMKDEPLKICPKCGKELRRLINGGGAIIFKGSGFYVNDKNGKGGASGSRKTAEDGRSGGETSKTAPACPGCNKADTSVCPKASGE